MNRKDPKMNYLHMTAAIIQSKDNQHISEARGNGSYQLIHDMSTCYFPPESINRKPAIIAPYFLTIQTLLTLKWNLREKIF